MKDAHKLVVAILLLAGMGQGQKHPMDNMDMSGSPSPGPAAVAATNPSAQTAVGQIDAATRVMHSHHMESGPHMRMTPMREPRPGDLERAQEVVEAAKRAMEKYKDYRNALADGYQIFLPNVPQPQYHFTNYGYGYEAAFHFNPEHPTSLLYEKTKDGGYTLMGAMYTAPKDASEADLDRRIPLSVARWHLHVNFCFPPKERRAEMFQPNPKFGMAGSITTQEECDSNGGKFVPHLFGWMVHVYPYEKTPAAIWGMSTQDSMDHMHMH